MNTTDLISYQINHGKLVQPILIIASRPTWRRRLDLAWLVVASAIVAILFLWLHAEITPSSAPDMAFLRDPDAMPTRAMAWWAWWDQGMYERAAVAWASGVTDPIFHWYPASYPLLAAAFVHVTPADPFLVPDLACLLGALWLFCGVASRLLAGVPFRTPLACALFVGSAVLAPRMLWAWVVPWTTTPETLCIYGTLLAAMLLAETGRRRDAFLTGLTTASIAGFRPVDGIVAGLAICLTVGPVLLSRPRRLPSLVTAVMGGALLPTLVVGGAYFATWGTQLSGYFALSERIGFEPRLLALRWVTLMIDPRPLVLDGRGLAEVYFWIVPGCMGLAATLAAVRGIAAVPHRLVVTMLAGDVVMFLIYRDLHPTGLWLHANYHYFKWTMPIFAVYAFRLLPMVFDRKGRWGSAAIAACMVVPLLFCWRVGFSSTERLPSDKGNRTVTVPSGLSPVNAVVLVPVRGTVVQDLEAATAVTASGTALRYGLDFVIYGDTDALRIVPLRPLPMEPTIFRFSDQANVDWDRSSELARQTIKWGLPFWTLRRTDAQR